MAGANSRSNHILRLIFLTLVNDLMELRPYQREVIENIQTAWDSHSRVMLQMPTGTGKTNVFCEIIRLHRNQFVGKRILVLTHKRELVFQTKDRLRSFGIVPGVILAGSEEKPEHQVQVATIQSLIRRKQRINFLNELSLIIIDEAHHSPSDSYRKLISFYRFEHLLGVTATPRRSDGQGFNDIFGTLIRSWQIRRFITEGYLADIEHRKTETYHDISKRLADLPIDPISNDYDENQLERLMTMDNNMADAVKSYIRYRGNFKKSIVFAVNVSHSKKLTSRFLEENIKAAHIDGETDDKKRAEILEDFKSGIISVLCNVGIITEGFDCPDAEIVQLVRPTKSITLYLQQVGRIMRPKPNGSHALILDSASCYDEFGSAKANRRWTLDSDDANGWPEESDDKDSALEPKAPLEKEKPMVIVDERVKCAITKEWFEALPVAYQAYFLERFSYLDNHDRTAIINGIWTTKEWNLSGLQFESISALKKLTNIVCLNISSTKCIGLRPIMSSTKLTSLDISNTPVNILRLPNENREGLKRLNISKTRIENVSVLSDYPMIEVLNINDLKLNSGSYDSISGLKKLCRFSAMNSNFASISILYNSKDFLMELKLNNTNLESIATIHHFQKLKYLDISGTRIKSLDKIEQCQSLETLNIKGLGIPAWEIKKLRNKRPFVWIED